MFTLTQTELDRAKDAVDNHGYSTMLPNLPEWVDLDENWEAIRASLCNVDLEVYRPMEALAITAAKGEESTRVLHLLHPQDMIFYTCLVLLLKNDIEARRVPLVEERVYSYRASDSPDLIYDTTQRLHEGYIERLKEKVHGEGVTFVGVTDIADFYASISHIKLQSLLTKLASTKRSKQAAGLLISTFARRIMGKMGRGIPTGPYASRLVAEVLLDDFDRRLMSKEVDFVRWVDDFNIFSPSYAEAQRTMMEFSTWLYREHGLFLQLSKTRVFSVRQYSDKLLRNVGDFLSGKPEVLSMFEDALDYDIDDDDDFHEVEASMDDAQAMELLEMLVDAVPRDGRIDFRMVDFAVRKLRRIPVDRRRTCDELLTFLLENIDRLAPAIEGVMRLIFVIRPEDARRCTKIAIHLLKSIEDLSFIDHHAVWILTTLARDERWGCLDELIDLAGKSTSDVVKRYATLAVARIGGRGRLLRSANANTDEGDLVRLASLKAGGGSLAKAGRDGGDGPLEAILRSR